MDMIVMISELWMLIGMAPVYHMIVYPVYGYDCYNIRIMDVNRYDT